MTRDDTRWVETADEPIFGQTTYERVQVSPELPPTDEVRTEEELAETEAAVEAEAVDEDGSDLRATDGAIEAAAELGIDISTVVGTGHEGRVTKADVEAAATG